MWGDAMNRTKKALVVGSVVAAMVGFSAPAFADPPGPGDTQCKPGQNGQPQPGAKNPHCPPAK
jgi:hypothetical protein